MGLSCALCLNAFNPLLGRYVDSATMAQIHSDFIGNLGNALDQGFDHSF